VIKQLLYKVFQLSVANKYDQCFHKILPVFVHLELNLLYIFQKILRKNPKKFAYSFSVANNSNQCFHKLLPVFVHLEFSQSFYVSRKILRKISQMFAHYFYYNKC